MNNCYTDAAERRKLRRRILDSKKSNAIQKPLNNPMQDLETPNVRPAINSVDFARSPFSDISNDPHTKKSCTEAAERRRIRKQIVNSKKSKILQNPLDVENIVISTPNVTQATNNNTTPSSYNILRYISTNGAPSINGSTSAHNSYLKKLSTANGQVCSSPRVISPVRMQDLSSNEETHDEHIRHVPRTPFTEISNVTTRNTYAAKKRKERKLHLDFRRSNTSSMTSGSTSKLTEKSSLTRLSSAKRKNLSCSRTFSPVAMADLTSNEDHHVDNQVVIQDFVQDPYTGICEEYLDHGDQSLICELCKAKLWNYEGHRTQNIGGYTCYMLCCGYGKVQLPVLKDAQPNYQNLFRGVDSKSKYFIKNIRRYNSMFSFTSMGGKVDKSINRGNAPFVFRLSGQNYHTMGSLLPENGSKPKFSQLYIYDTDNEVSNRQSFFRESSDPSTSTSQDLQLIEELKCMLDSHNELVKVYRMVRDCFTQNPHVNMKLRLICKRERDGRTHNLPTASEVAAIIPGDIDNGIEKRDIVVETKTGKLKHISELHPSYLPLQYPILFPYGEDGYRVDILHRNFTTSNKSNRQYVTMRQFFSYRIQDRVNTFSLILNSRRLFQQFLVDGYTMIETERLNYIRHHQKAIRCESYETLRNIRNNGNEDISNVGQRIILPSSFTGGTRYMMQNYLDAMAICRWLGYPDFFITITCNPKWPEIKRFLKDTTIKPEDRPDILCRLFKIKLDSIMKDLKERSLFGNVSAVVYTIEFQKRGLPHAHICLFMHADHKLHTVDHIDKFISAEIPDKNEDPQLYYLVKEFMMHGPCGSNNPKCPCMIDRKCSKNFPKKFSPHTTTDRDGFPVYRRRDCGAFVEKSKVKLDNRMVVPYNKQLLKRYQAHINVEWCNQASSIKYLFKYINKGPDRATVKLVRSDKEDDDEPKKNEIKDYYNCRYISACEASWRIFAYDVHYRQPSVIRLPFHLQGQQQLVYGEDDDINDVLNKPSVASSMFLDWMKCNASNDEAKKLTYVEFPTKFVWKTDKGKRFWARRQQGKSIGRIHSVSPALGEAYFLRILLNIVKGPTSFEDIRTVNGDKFPTFRDACYARGLLNDDMEYVEAIKEASHSGSGYYLRSLFGTMLLSHSLSIPEFVWNNTWKYLSDDIIRRQKRILNVTELSLSEDRIKNLTLHEIELFLLRNDSTLRDFKTMPYPDSECVSSSNNLLIVDELSYDVGDVQNEFESLLHSLTNEQKMVFDEIMSAVEGNKGGVFFVYGYGGTGKTFLWKTLSTAIRSRGQIVLNVASSGIASLLLTGGRTAHSRFHIPIDLDEYSMCRIKPDSDDAHLLKETRLIIWDEAPMVHKHAFEALDRTLNDVLTSESSINSQTPFGGKVVVFGGDFRQILPVVTNDSRQEIVNASLSSSYIWDKCKLLRLTRNMRLSVGSQAADVEQTKVFAKWLLDVGEGNVGEENDGETTIDIPDELLINDSSDPISGLIDFVYPSILQNYNNKEFFRERAILAPKNEVVHEINDRLLSLFPGDEHEYLSSDSICPTEKFKDPLQADLYSPDVLNGLKISGLPNHRLVLKVGVPIMLLRNIDQQNGLCNGTRLQVISLGKRVIEAEIITGSNMGTRTFISRINMIPSDKRIPFKFQRRQFPLSVCFAMTINKSQGQSLSRVGLYLKDPVFSHGQLYVALSRVKSRDGIRLLIFDRGGKVTNQTTNVVYKEIFSNL